MYGYGASANSYSQLDRPLLSKYLQILQIACAEALQVVEFTISNFGATSMVHTTVLSRNSLIEMVNGTISQYLSMLSFNVPLLVLSLAELAEANLIPTAFNTDWSLEYGNESNSFLIRSIPHIFNNSTCNCVISNMCQEPLRIGPPDLILPGLVVGCSPLEGLRFSTLECFFSSDCISTVINYLEYYTQIDGSPPVNFTVSTSSPIIIPPLSSSILSRFPPNTSMEAIVGELFVEEVDQRIDYEAYYAKCAPLSCRYSIVIHNNTLYIITELIGLYGGLTIGLRLVIWNLVKFYYRKKAWFIRRRTIRPLT